MNRSAQFAAIGRIYETILSSTDFRPLLDIVLTWTGADDAYLWQYDNDRDASVGVSRKKLHRRKFTYHDLYTEGVARARPPVNLGAEGVIWIQDEMLSTAIACLAMRGSESIYLELRYNAPANKQSEAQKAAFTELLHILRHAISIDIAPVSAQFGRQAVQILDRMAIGIAIYDPTDGTVTGANHRARHLLAKKGIHLSDRAAFAMQKMPLAKGLAGYAAKVASARNAPILIDWPDDNQMISLVAFALDQSPAALDAPVAFMFLPDSNSETLQSYIAQKHGLTHREQAVAKALLCGHKLPDIAENLHLGHETVRSHAKAIFAKCDVHGHAEFVAKFLTGIDAFDWDALVQSPPPVARVAR